MSDIVNHLWAKASIDKMDKHGIVWTKPVFESKHEFAKLLLREVLDELSDRAANEGMPDVGGWIEDHMKDHFGEF